MRHKTSTFDGLSNELKDYIANHLKIEKSCSLRKVKKIVNHIRLVLAAANNVSAGKVLITGLCVLKIVEPELYIKAGNNTLTLDEMEKFFKFNNWKSERGIFSQRNWTYCLADELPDDTGFEGVALNWRYINLDRETIIPQFCRLVDSFKLANH